MWPSHYPPIATRGKVQTERRWTNPRRRTLGAMCEIWQRRGGGEELLAEPCVSAHCSQTAVRQEDKAVWNNREFM